LSAISDIPEDGIRLDRGGAGMLRFSIQAAVENKEPPDRGDGFDLVLVDWTFGSEELSCYSACLRELERKPCLMMQVGDAGSLGLRDGVTVAIETRTGSLEATLCVKENMAPGILFMPRHRQIVWQKLGDSRTYIARDRIRKLLPRKPN